MSLRATMVAILLVALSCLAGCSRLPGKPAPGPEVPRPDSVLDPVVLYRQLLGMPRRRRQARPSHDAL